MYTMEWEIELPLELVTRTEFHRRRHDTYKYSSAGTTVQPWDNTIAQPHTATWRWLHKIINWNWGKKYSCYLGVYVCKRLILGNKINTIWGKGERKRNSRAKEKEKKYSYVRRVVGRRKRSYRFIQCWFCWHYHRSSSHYFPSFGLNVASFVLDICVFVCLCVHQKKIWMRKERLVFFKHDDIHPAVMTATAAASHRNIEKYEGIHNDGFSPSTFHWL